MMAGSRCCALAERTTCFPLLSLKRLYFRRRRSLTETYILERPLACTASARYRLTKIMRRRTFLQAGTAALAFAEDIPEKLIVLTLDDAVKSHRTFAAPYLKELGFGATFFVTHLWMDDAENFMSW